jgi:hypothetical protein
MIAIQRLPELIKRVAELEKQSGAKPERQGKSNS